MTGAGSSRLDWLRSQKALTTLILMAALLAIAPSWYFHVRRSLDPFIFNDDARILIWPFFRGEEPGLFPDDLFLSYYTAGLPEGFRLLYSAVARLGWVRHTSIVLPYLSVLATLGFAAATAYRMAGTRAALLVAVLILGSDVFIDRAGGGLPRSFAFVLTAAGLYAMVTRRPVWLACLAVLGMAFYPVTAALLGLLLAFLLVLPEAYGGSGAKLWHRLLLLGLTLLALVALARPIQSRLAAFGPPIRPTELTSFEEAGPGGRLDPEHHPPYPGYFPTAQRHAHRTLVGYGAPLLGHSLGSLGLSRDRQSQLVWVVLGTSLGLMLMRRATRVALVPLGGLWLVSVFGHALSVQFAPQLFLPERYVQYTVPLLSLLVLGIAWGGVERKPSRWTEPRIAVGCGLLLFLFGSRGTSFVGVEVVIPEPERPLYAHLAQLPKNSLIAGWPTGPVENVPYLSRRRVLTAHQLQMPFHALFTETVRDRVRAVIAAELAPGPEPACRLLTHFGVTHFLVDLAPAAQVRSYYRPFNAEITRHLAARGDKPSFLVELARTTPSLPRFGEHVVVDRPRVLSHCGETGTTPTNPADLAPPR